MIGFDLTPEQKALQEKARKFANEVILPVAAKYDREGTFPLEVMEKAHQEGFFTPLVPKEYGGSLGFNNCNYSGAVAVVWDGVRSVSPYPIIVWDERSRTVSALLEIHRLSCLEWKLRQGLPWLDETIAALDGDFACRRSVDRWRLCRFLPRFAARSQKKHKESLAHCAFQPGRVIAETIDRWARGLEHDRCDL
jgi:hypothetical protein